MSIAIVTVATGAFARFLPGWWRTIEALEYPPDEVIVIEGDEFSPLLFNEAVDRTTTDWVCKLDVDDTILPGALSSVETSQHDIKIFGVQWYTEGQHHTWYPDGMYLLDGRDNACSAASPFRRAVWEAAPYRDMPYWDWVFWIEAAHNGFTFEPARTIDYEYRMHDEQVTANGDHGARMRQVLRWRQRLLQEVSV